MLNSRYVETLYNKYRVSDVVVWRMKYLSGDILPEINRNDLVQDHVGISYCYKNKGTKIYFDANENNEDFKYLMKLITSNSYIITPEIYYNVNH